MNQRSGIRELRVLQVGLHFVRIVYVGIATDTLGLLKLAEHTCTLNVLEVDNGILREVHNGTKVIVKTFRCLGVFEDLDKLLGSKLLVVFLRNLYTDLHVRWSAGHHIFEQGNTLFAIQLSKIGDHEFRVHLMTVLEDTLDVVDIGVVLSCPLPHPRTFAKLAYVGAIVVSEYPVLHDSISHLGSSSDKVDLKQFCLEVSMFLFVVLEGLEEEGSCLLNTIAREERLCRCLDVNERPTFGANQSLRQIQGSLRIVEQKLTEHA
mmetsp:Transcript_40571/g.84890  ORF Transcript_40571/g.84890 Transcript_40571/m.84890 type:complete len:263 (-) Transcript_40571:883-1671(-)